MLGPICFGAVLFAVVGLLCSCSGAGTSGSGGGVGGAGGESGDAAAGASGHAGGGNIGGTSSCPPGKLDCNLDPGDGCEVDAAVDPLHCGKCDRSCAGGPCDEGRCGVAELAQVRYLKGAALDAEYVYYSGHALAGGEEEFIARVPRRGGPVETLVHGMIADAIAVDSSSLFFTYFTKLYRMPKAGGEPTLIAEKASALFDHLKLATDATGVYYLSALGDFPTGTILRVDKAGGPVTEMHNAGGSTGFVATAADATNLYSIDGNYVVRRQPLGGGAVETVGVLQNQDASPHPYLTIDGTSLYFASYTKPGIYRVPLDGSGTVPFRPVSGGALAATADAVFYEHRVEGSYQLIQAPLPSGDDIVLHQGIGRTVTVVADDVGVYWTESDETAGFDAIRGLTR